MNNPVIISLLLAGLTVLSPAQDPAAAPAPLKLDFEALTPGPLPDDFVLTDKGRAAWDVLSVMWSYGERWLFDEAPPAELYDRDTGQAVEPTVIDRNTGRPLELASTRRRPRPKPTPSTANAKPKAPAALSTASPSSSRTTTPPATCPPPPAPSR